MTPANILIRPATADDAPAILQAHYDAVHQTAVQDYPPDIIARWAPPVGDERIADFIANPHGEIRRVAELDGRVMGFAALVVAVSELRACYVSPDAGRQGLGAALLAEIEKVARAEGVSHLLINSSLTAEKFYLRHGYRALGPFKHVMRGGLEMDAVKMRKDF